MTKFDQIVHHRLIVIFVDLLLPKIIDQLRQPVINFRFLLLLGFLHLSVLLFPLIVTTFSLRLLFAHVGLAHPHELVLIIQLLAYFFMTDRLSHPYQ